MMQFDDRSLRAMWQQQPAPRMAADGLRLRVERHRRMQALRRAVEIALTLGGVAALAWPGADGRLTPQQWLLIPFFAVFLTVCWTLLLRRGGAPRTNATQPGAVYANLRKQQLRRELHRVKLARRAADVLVLYALSALAGVHVLGTGPWRESGWWLMGWALLWWLATRWLTQRRRRMHLREYQAMHRLRGAG